MNGGQYQLMLLMMMNSHEIALNSCHICHIINVALKPNCKQISDIVHGVSAMEHPCVC